MDVTEIEIMALGRKEVVGRGRLMATTSDGSFANESAQRAGSFK